MDELASTEELRHRKAAQTSAEAEWHRRQEDVLRIRDDARKRYGRLLQEFVDRAHELGASPKRVDANLSGWSIGTVTWAEGYDTRIGVVSAPGSRYGIMRKKTLGRGLRETTSIVETLSTFTKYQISDHAPSYWGFHGPADAHATPVFNTGDEGRVTQLLSVTRDALEEALLGFIP